MSACLVCGVQHVVEDAAHKAIIDLRNRVGSLEAKVREAAKPAAVYPANTGTTATTATFTPNVYYSFPPAPADETVPEAAPEVVPDAPEAAPEPAAEQPVPPEHQPPTPPEPQGV